MPATAEKVRNFIDLHSILHPAKGKVLVALSGGADSVALLSLLLEMGYTCRALHCNFHLRGRESDRDETFVRDLCTQLGVPLEVEHFNVESYRHAHGGSVEMACRDLRYEWFGKRLSVTGAQAVAVAHHRDDNVETLLLNLLRGTSINGLTGMEPYDHRNHVARPLLCISRVDIENYLAEKGLSFVTDSTNTQSIYRRNFLRNEILPALRRVFPDADSRIADTIGNLRQNAAFYDESAGRAIAAVTDDEGIDVAALAESQPVHAPLLLWHHLRHTGLSMTQAANIIERHHISGLTFITRSGTLLLNRCHLRMTNGNCPPKLKIEVVSREDVDFSCCPGIAYFSPEILNHHISVRTWQPGDRIRPWGMKGTKKLSDIFSDAKIALDRKHAIAVVTADDEIVWVAGLRNSSLFPLSDNDDQAVEITITDIICER